MWEKIYSCKAWINKVNEREVQNVSVILYTCIHTAQLYIYIYICARRMEKKSTKEKKGKDRIRERERDHR